MSKTYYSHPPDKLLRVHIDGVISGVKQRTQSKIAELAATFHDLGKLNPNFQRKLNPDGSKIGYSNHSYLSAFAWLCFYQQNRKLVKSYIGNDRAVAYSIAAIVAHHHGNLPDLKTLEARIFKRSERHNPTEEFRKFLKSYSDVDIPISDYLQQLLPHNPFQVFQVDEKTREDFLKLNLYNQTISDPLDLFLKTQFSFACFIEADKRDASNNKIFNRQVLGHQLKVNFAARLEKKLNKLKESSTLGDVQVSKKKRALNELRTQIREQAVQNIKTELAQGRRIFALTAPTGAGKTMMLLALTNEILRHDQDLSVIYALPFLSITEQVEGVCNEVFKDDGKTIVRIDSKSENKRIDDLQGHLECDQSPEKLKELLREIFSENTFDYPFIVTTFVQVFETLVSNRNSTLLKLPNFAKTIFLLDEIQALPPNLYVFFAAWLDSFCEKFDSYAIFSTATMPYLRLPEKDYKLVDPDKIPHLLFKKYAEKEPKELLDAESYYDFSVFNRYRIKRLEYDSFGIEHLAQEVRNEKDSCLVILNTIKDTKDLYRELTGQNDEDSFFDYLINWRYPTFPADGEFDKDEYEGECILLNTHFTLNDRRWKLELCKRRIKNGKKVVLISTQLIEAGVDIDFPVLYRDMCPLPSLIQSAGRCNRNNELPVGRVYLFELKNESSKSSASQVYRNAPEWFLNFTKEKILGTVSEKDLFTVQRNFFKEIGDKLEVGWHKQAGETIHMVECVNRLCFEMLGKFRLIDDSYFGEEYRYYVPRDARDKEFEKLLRLVAEHKGMDFKSDEAKALRSQIERKLKEMSVNTVAIRLPPGKRDHAPAPDGEIMGIHKLAQYEDYSSATGIRLSPNSRCII